MEGQAHASFVMPLSQTWTCEGNAARTQPTTPDAKMGDFFTIFVHVDGAT
jgi:hypothetical protein